MFPIAILAGGLATRLRPITEKIPKSLIAVAGKPFIFHQLYFLKKANIKRVVLLVGHLGEMIQEQVGDGKDFELEITYVQDGPSPLGTGGALLKALPVLGQNFFVLYGDSFLPINYEHIAKTFLQSKKLALMTIMKNNNCWDKSNVIYHDGMVVTYNKDEQLPAMNYIDYGLGVFSIEAFNNKLDLGKNFDLAKLYTKLALENQLVGHEVFERFYEIGSMQGLAETEKYLLMENK